MTIRGYEAGDFEAMFRLDEVCFDPRFRFSRRAMRRFAEAHNARLAVAESNGKLAGFCIVHVEEAEGGRIGYVVTLDVAPASRRRAIAAQLMNEIESAAAKAGCVAMTLHVFAGNAAAIRFYERNGYTFVGSADAFYGVDGGGNELDALLYRKNLQPGS